TRARRSSGTRRSRGASCRVSGPAGGDGVQGTSSTISTSISVTSWLSPIDRKGRQQSEGSASQEGSSEHGAGVGGEKAGGGEGGEPPRAPDAGRHGDGSGVHAGHRWQAAPPRTNLRRSALLPRRRPHAPDGDLLPSLHRRGRLLRHGSDRGRYSRHGDRARLRRARGTIVVGRNPGGPIGAG